MKNDVNEVKNHKQGFTLLELLVVVLIIGILAAIALPQYKSAVRKARVTEAKISLRALIDATDRYILQHGHFYPDSNLAELDIEIQTNTKNWEIVVDECSDGGPSNRTVGCMALATPKWEEGWVIDYWSTNYMGGEDCEGFCGHFTCDAISENGHKICKSLGGTLIDGYDKFYQLN